MVYSALASSTSIWNDANPVSADLESMLAFDKPWICVTHELANELQAMNLIQIYLTEEVVNCSLGVKGASLGAFFPR